MLLSKVKSSIQYRLSGDKKLPDDDVLQDLIQEATIYVANRCDPAELTGLPTDENKQILKMIEGGLVIFEPEYPDLTDETLHIQIDEVLAFSVVNYTCFLITANPNYKALADEDIGLYRCEYARVGYGE